jgi:sulfur-carrier protein
MTIQFYGKLASLLGREIHVAVGEACSVADIRKRIMEVRPDVAESLGDRRVLACVGGALVGDDHRVAPSDTVEFLAPVSGG